MLRIIDTIYDVLTALEKIGYVTDLKLDGEGGNILLEEEGAFALRAVDIKFGFPDEDKRIIEGLSFDILPNNKVVLAGESGSGKTLLLQILAGVLPYGDGEFFINDVPFKNYNREKLYEKIGVAFPTNQIFEGTFRENITMGRAISQKKLIEVIKLLKLNAHLNKQAEGVDSFVDSGGRRLPRSVIQKLLIARILVGEPKLLLMEDPLQFVEEAEKKRIIDYLMDEQRNWTLIVVSDFYYWKEKSNQILELKKSI